MLHGSPWLYTYSDCHQTGDNCASEKWFYKGLDIRYHGLGYATGMAAKRGGGLGGRART